MNDFTNIMQRVSRVLEYTTGIVPYEKNIAYALGMSPTQYANAKARNAIPYKQIAEFCREYCITINFVLYGQDSQILLHRDEKIFQQKLLKSLSTTGVCASFESQDIKQETNNSQTVNDNKDS